MRDLITYQLALIAAATDPELDPNVIIPATLTLIGVLGAGWLAARASRSRPKPPPPPDVPNVAPSPLAAFSGTQNEFMALVIEDNTAIRQEVAGLRREVVALRDELAATRSAHGAFERAVRRYLELLASAWVGPTPMPWPAEDDLGILERTLPRRARRPRPN